MNFKDHRLLSHYLLDNALPALDASRARAFVVGCLYPDRNYLTYLRGHTFRGKKRFTRRALKRLSHARRWGLYRWFRFGVLVHYLTDAFTFAHSPLFDGSLAAHVSYETHLHAYFPQFLYGYAQTKEKPCPSLFPQIFSQLSSHQEAYLLGEPSLQKDCRCIVDACLLTIAGVVPKVQAQKTHRVRRAVSRALSRLPKRKRAA